MLLTCWHFPEFSLLESCCKRTKARRITGTARPCERAVCFSFALMRMASESSLTFEVVLCIRRKEGKIQAYGLATWNCFRVAPSKPGHLSLQEVWDVAAKVGAKNHGFRSVFMPLFFLISSPSPHLRPGNNAC